MVKPQPLKMSRLAPTTMASRQVISGAIALSQPKRFLYLIESLRDIDSMNHHVRPRSSCSYLVLSSDVTMCWKVSWTICDLGIL